MLVTLSVYRKMNLPFRLLNLAVAPAVHLILSPAQDNKVSQLTTWSPLLS